MEHADDARFLQPHNRAFCHRRDGRYAPWLPRQAPLAAELVGSKNCDDRFFPLVGNNGDLDLPLLHVEHSIRSVALREDDLILAIFGYGSALADFGEIGFGIEWWSSVSSP
jgi:hypothetical protein